MDRVSRYTPYPCHADQVDYWPNYYPRSEVAPPHMYIPPTRPPVNYEHWPWGSNYGYASPSVPCHGCCNHSHLPTHYSWRPPYSHVPPAYAPGGYPPFPGEYMPPYYAMEQPQFMYEKNMPRDHHCCGCPNHLCGQKEQKKVKIEEEEEPEREQNKHAPVAPFKFKHSHPLMWLPINSGDNNEHQKDDSNDGSQDVKQHNGQKNDEKYPGAWFTRHPFESNKPGSPKEKQESKMSNHEPDRKGHFPFPVFWMPYMPEEQGKAVPEEKNVTNSKPCLEPVKEPEGKNVTNLKPCSEPVKDSGLQTGVHSIPTVKDIPVKEVKQHGESVVSTSKEGKRDTSLKDGSNTGEKLAKQDSKRKASSPPKTQKLPPVCLRVDPLPRRKDNKGKSRSPSPPRDKRKLDQLSNGVRKVLPSANHEADQVVTKESKEGKGTTKAIKVVDASTCQEEPSKKQIEVEHNKGKVSVDCSKSGRAVRPEDTLLSGGEKKEIVSDKEVVEHEVKETRRPKMSEEQAAVTIQSAYRAFVIHRWEPVKKLKQIARVREKMTEVNASIQAMESSSDIQGNEKQRTIIAEIIMGLLLELDTIQGLHPSIREVRKSVVRELVALQEKLDVMMNEKSKASEEQQLAAKCVGNASRETDGTSIQSINETQPKLVEPCLTNQIDRKTYEASEISEQSAEEPKVIPESCMIEDNKPAVEPMLVEGEQDSQAEATTFPKKGNEGQVLGLDTEFPVQNKSSDGMIDSLATGVGTQFDELAKEVSDDNCKQLEEEKVSQSEASIVRYDGQVLGYECPLQHNSSLQGMIDSLANGDKPRHLSTELPKEASDVNRPSGVEEPGLANQPEGRLTEESSEFNHVIPLGEIICSHVTETNQGNEIMENNKLHDESVTTDQVENATENVEFEPDKCFAQSSECSNMLESPEAPDETGHPVIDSPKGEEAEEDISQEGLSAMEMEDASKESPDTNAAADILEEGVKFGADIFASHQCSAEPTCDACSVVNIEEEKQPIEAEQQHSLLEDKVNFAPEMDNTPEIMSLAATGGQTVEMNSGQIRHVKAERDEKLMQENELLRDMVEKLVKSGQEQLGVISNLSGRVKDLEKNLSKRRRMKVKPHRGKRSGSLQEWTDGLTV